MKNKTLLILASFIIGIVTVFTVGFTSANNVYNSNSGRESIVQTGSNAIYEENKNNTSNNNFDSDDEKQDETEIASPLKFELSNASVIKRKEIVGETTTYVVDFKVFVTNDSKVDKKLLSSAFIGSYDISDYALLYSFDCLESEDYKVVGANDTVDFDFSIKYIITETDKFQDNIKYNLDLRYLNSEIISVLV